MSDLHDAVEASSLLEIGAAADRRLRRLLECETQRWCQVDPELAQPLGELLAFVTNGGKRLRPAFCHWGFVAAGGDPNASAVVDVGAALELLHGFALIHDDVMDGSAVRRNRPTVHMNYVGQHNKGGWNGEARRFGEGVAILLGDLAFVYADVLMSGAPAAALAVFNELRIELMFGQYLDLHGAVTRSYDERTARRVALFKSAKYTVERPLHLGAALAGRLDELAAPFSDYGLRLGEAFQLRDDVLGAFGDAATIGKPVGDDFREGKPTPLVASAMRRACDRSDHAALRVLAQLGRADLNETAIEQIRSVIEETGARAEIEARICELTDQACEMLSHAEIAPHAQTALRGLASYVATRDR